MQSTLHSWAQVPKGGASRAVAVHLTLRVISSAVINQVKCVFLKQRGRAVCPTVLCECVDGEWWVPQLMGGPDSQQEVLSPGSSDKCVTCYQKHILCLSPYLKGKACQWLMDTEGTKELLPFLAGTQIYITQKKLWMWLMGLWGM